MDEKPELIAFSQNKIGGVQNFYFNILSHDPYNLFDKTWIFTDRETETEARLPGLYNICNELIFRIYKNEGLYQVAKRLQKLISEREGIALTNFVEELATLHIYRREKKTIYFVCHDEWYLNAAKEFEFLIDVFIAHNIEFYERMVELFPGRKSNIFYIPYGVSIPTIRRKENLNDPLKIVLLARLHQNKGVYDIPLIQEELLRRGIFVKWTIIGDGPEKQNLINQMKSISDVNFFTPPDNDAVITLLATQDVYILPSRLDGLPVSMLEAMSVGCVPVLSEFNKGINKIIPGTVGFVHPIGDIAAFADSITALNNDRPELEKRSVLSKKLVTEEYNILDRSKQYFDLFANYKNLKKRRVFKLHRYDGGFLHHPFIPRIIRMAARKIKGSF
jgi:glycosyltransferase involved in cell wall biosynthesis